MVTIDQAELDAQLQRFSQSVAGKALFIGRTVQQVLKLETNRLCKTLIRITPPRNKEKAAKQMGKDFARKFGLLSDVDTTYPARYSPPLKKQGQGDTLWFLWNSHLLLGVARSRDMRGATWQELRDMDYRAVITKGGRLDEGQRGKQKVRIIKRHLFDPNTVKKYYEATKKHLGRMKAGWLVGWSATGGGGRVPQWVSNHAQGARGGADLAQLVNKEIPVIRVWNTAKWIGSDYMKTIAHAAMKIRMKAMVQFCAKAITDKQGKEIMADELARVDEMPEEVIA